MADSPSSSAGGHSSDLQIAVYQLQHHKQLIGYRNLLSYSAALGVSVLGRSVVKPHLWKLKAEGQYSAVYESTLARNPPAKVIIKKPKASFSRDDAKIENDLQHKALSSIIQELRILAHQDLKCHPNLPRILGIFFEKLVHPEGTVPCLVLEQAVSDLSSYLRGNYMTISVDVMTSFSSDIAAGLSAIHAHGLVHGDLKPENILLTFRDHRLTAALADFGTCGVADQSLGQVGVIPGTVGFWAPEYYHDSKYHAWVNRPRRDIYGFGLIVFSIITYYQAPPFPAGSMALQHNDQKCLDFLRDRAPLAPNTGFLWNIVEHCVLSNPDSRWSLAQIGSELRRVQGNNNEYYLVQEHAEMELLKDPDNPRVNLLHRLELSEHLHSKLVSEYVMSSLDNVDVRLAVTLAALYSGVIGPALERPFNFVAKAQWLLKAAELGSLPAIQALFEDRNTLMLIETIGKKLLNYAPLTFNSPSISFTTLIDRLREFAKNSDIESLNLLVFPGEDIPEKLCLDGELFQPVTIAQEKLHQDFPGLQDEAHMENLLEQDLQILDSDAYDLIVSQKEDIFGYAYSDDLEGIMCQPNSVVEPLLPQLLSMAILGGSSNTARHLLNKGSINSNSILIGSPTGRIRNIGMEIPNLDAAPSETPQDSSESEPESDATDGSQSHLALGKDDFNLSYLDFAIVLGRRAVILALLEHGGLIHAASEDRPSSLHYLSRFDDAELARIVCQSCMNRKAFQGIMESKPSQGVLEGISAIELNMFTGRWSNVHHMIEYAEDLDKGQGEGNLLYLALSRVRPVPLYVIKELLDRGFNPDIAHMAAQPPLYWAIGQSNVAATELLLRYGASLCSPGAYDLVSYAKECLEEIDLYGDVVVVDEYGKVCPGGLERMKQAAKAVYTLALIAFTRNENWIQELADFISEYLRANQGMVWRANKLNATEVTIILELPFLI